MHVIQVKYSKMLSLEGNSHVHSYEAHRVSPSKVFGHFATIIVWGGGGLPTAWLMNLLSLLLQLIRLGYLLPYGGGPRVLFEEWEEGSH